MQTPSESSNSPDNVDPVVQLVPEALAIGVVKEERVDGQRHENLDDHLDAEDRDGQEPRADRVVRPEKRQQPDREDDQKATDRQGPDVPVQSRIVRGAQRHEQGVHDIVDEMQHRSEQQAQVPAQPQQPVLLVERGQPGLQGQDVEQHGRHGAYALLVLVVDQQDPVEEAADVVAYDRYDAGHAEDGREGLAAVDHEGLEHDVAVEGVVVVVAGEDLADLLEDAEDPEGAEDRGHVETGPLGLGEGRQAVVGDEGATQPVALVDGAPDGVAVVPEDELADAKGHKGAEDRETRHQECLVGREREWILNDVNVIHSSMTNLYDFSHEKVDENQKDLLNKH